MKHKFAKMTGAAVLAVGLAVSGAGTANAASQFIHDGYWQYGVSSTVNWTAFTPNKYPSKLKNLVLQQGAAVNRFNFDHWVVVANVQMKRHPTQNWQGINW
ncbi:hypothetical protein [Leucobacter sp. USHLN153]|uniref:hypothetical protein n=1 Tax=Leucobacter sp. USHLN153 TaxID=3081268 RepID=UPI00301AEA0B